VVAVTVKAGGRLQVALGYRLFMHPVFLVLGDFLVTLGTDLLHVDRQLAARSCIKIRMGKTVESLAAVAIGAFQGLVLLPIDHTRAVHG
jgi:hypothetical protein